MRDRSFLVADGDPIIRSMLEHILAAAGLQAFGAESAAEALNLLAARPFGFLLTNRRLPDMDGLEFAGKARELVPDLQIAVETGVSLWEFPGSASAPDEPAATRPFNIDTVLELAKAWTSCPSPGSAAAPGDAGWRWTCPRCRTVFCGWSRLDVCSECGYGKKPGPARPGRRA